MTDFRLEGEIRVPAEALRALSAAARRHGEPVATAVRDAGRAAGEEFLRRISSEVPLADLDMADFWSAVNAETGARGLGTYEWQSMLGGYAELLVEHSADSPGTGEPVVSAPFTEGFIEGLLGAAVQEPVAVVQAPPDGSRALRYVVGSPSVLRHIRLRLASGSSLEKALEGI